MQALRLFVARCVSADTALERYTNAPQSPASAKRATAVTRSSSTSDARAWREHCSELALELALARAIAVCVSRAPSQQPQAPGATW